MKKIAILYHTGVGSTKLMAFKIKDKLEEALENLVIDIENIEDFKDYLNLKNYDLLIFGFPLRNGSPSKTFVNALGRIPISLEKLPCALFTTCDFLPGNSLRDVAFKLRTKNYYCIESTYFKTPSPKLSIKMPFLNYFKKYEANIDYKINRFILSLCSQLNKKVFVYHNPPFRYEALFQKSMSIFGPKVNKAFIDYEVCDKCGKCIDLCPQHCYFIDEDGYIKRNDKNCEACLRCIHYCPQKSISFKKNKHIDLQLKDTLLEELLETNK